MTTKRSEARKAANAVPVNMSVDDTHAIANAVSDYWEPKYDRLRSALELINAIKTDMPRMGFQEYYDAVTDIAREVLYDDAS